MALRAEQPLPILLIIVSAGHLPSVLPQRGGDKSYPAALAEALRQLLRPGADSACLEVASDNEPAIGLYRRFGFVTREQTEVYRRALAG